MNQQELFHEDINEAFDTLVKLLGGYKKIGTRLWPNMKIASATTKLSNCFKEGKDEELKLSEAHLLLKWGRDAGIHTAIYWMCDDLYYEKPKTVTAEVRSDELKAEFVEKAKQLEALFAQISRNDEKFEGR